MHAVITAGGRVDGVFAEQIGGNVKALAPVGGQTLLARTILAARLAGVERVAVVGGAEVRAADGALADDFIPESRSGAENVHRALCFYGQEPLLYLTSDMPYVSGAFIREFLDRAPDSALAMPLADAGKYETRFPGAPDHATVIGGERIANGSAFFIPARAARTIDNVAQQLFDARKSLPRMAILLGPALLLKFAFRRLQIADVERKAAAVLGFSVRAVRDCAPELCFDVDTIEDYRYAIEHA